MSIMYYDEKMKISVVIASYNGERFIEEQINTIIQQTVPVDEIIISDDGSTDRTLAILRSYNDSRIRILTDNPNHGYCGNFSYAMQHATGDIIFLADQDDIWMENRVERVRDIFEKQKDAALVISNGKRIDAEGKRINVPFLKHLSEPTGKLHKDKYLGLSVYGIANGMCLCLRRSFAQEIVPFPDSSILHDVWICFCGLNRDAAYFVNEELVGYRIHDTNTSMRQNIGILNRIKRNVRIVAKQPKDLFILTKAMLEDMEKHKPVHVETYNQLQSLSKSYEMQIAAMNMTPVCGVSKLVKQFFLDNHYRSNGMKYLIMQILVIVFGRAYIP